MTLSLWMVNFDNPKLLLVAIPLFVLLLFMLTINFVKFEKEERWGKRKVKIFLFFTRTLIIALAVVALSGPFIIQQTTEAGTPEITLLIDNSSSMELFNINVDELKQSLEKEVPLTTGYIGFGETSMLGDGIFRYLHKELNNSILQFLLF